MATKKSQRIFIWVIAVVMIVGTIAGFVAMILAPSNQQADQDRINELTAQYQKDYQEYQAKLDEQTKELSDKYFDTFKPYESKATPFETPTGKQVATKDYVVGNGTAVTDELEYAIYYIGWNPKGKIFDSSFNEDSTALKRPLIHQADGLWDFGTGEPGSVIEGWPEGIKGMKVGGIRELTIPSDKAYKDQSKGEDIPANTPLKFIIMVIEAPKKITQPELPPELLQYYQTGAQ